MKTYRLRSINETTFNISHSEGGEYIVELSTGRGPRCSCPDFTYRQRICKHLRHAASFAATVQAVESRRGNGQRGVSPLR